MFSSQLTSCQLCMTNQLNNITINASGAFQSLSALNPTNALGMDCMCPVTLKFVADILLIPITHLLNTCIQTCSIPDGWKVPKLIPIPKNNNHSDVQNYRPIPSSLPCLKFLSGSFMTSLPTSSIPPAFSRPVWLFAKPIFSVSCSCCRLFPSLSTP